MNLSLMPDYIYQQFSAAGTPLSGGTVYFYQSETFTPKTVYADAAGTTPLGTSVTLSAAGTAVIFLDTGAYRIWIKDSMGSPVAPWVDGIVGGAATGATGTNATFGLYKVYNDVRALTGTPPDFVYVTGGTTEGDGGAGWFQLQPGSVLTEDGGILLTAASGSIVYRRVFDAVIDPQWYGVVYALNADQTYALNLALGASAAQNFPVLVTRSVYITSNISVPTGAMLETTLDGFFTAPGAVTMTFADGARFDGQGVTFGTNVQPLFGVGCCEAIRLSWMGGSVGDTRWVKFAASATAEYIAMADVSTSISSDPAVPANFALDFTEGAKITITALTNLTIGNLVYQGLGQIFQYNAIEYIGTISLPNTVSLLEWFGGISGGTPDNTIAFKAAAVSGSISLLPGRAYYVQDTGTAYVLPNALAIYGGVGSYLQINQRVGATSLALSTLNLTGTGQLDSSGDTQILGVIATASVTLTSINPASISDCNLNSINNLGAVRQSIITNFNGSISGSVSGSSSITFSGTTSVPANLLVSESYLIKSDASDSAKAVLFSLANGVSITIDNSSVECNGALTYSIDTTASITLNNCRNSGNFAFGLSNGFAKISLNGCGCVGNSTATLIDGVGQTGLTNIIIADPPSVITAATTTWHGSGSITSDGTNIILGADTTLDNTPFGTNTIRYAGIASDGSGTQNATLLAMWRYGGQVSIKVTYPSGVSPLSTVRLRVAFVNPQIGQDLIFYQVSMNVFGVNTPVGLASINGAVMQATANVWCGQVDYYTPNTGGPWNCTDIWGDIAYSKSSGQKIVGMPRIVVYNSGTGLIPSGTKIQITINAAAPGDAQYAKYWPLWGYSELAGEAHSSISPAIYTTGGPGLMTPYAFRHADNSGLQVVLMRRSTGNIYGPAVDLPVTVWTNGTTLNGSYS